MLKVSKMADYATVIMSQLAHSAAQPLSASQVSERAHVPLPTVSKILKLLNEAHLVVSMRGPQGGYQLAAKANAISVGQIITAIDGVLAMTECAQADSNCGLQSTCQLRANWRKINRRVLKLLDNISLYEMNGPLPE